MVCLIPFIVHVSSLKG